MVGYHFFSILKFDSLDNLGQVVKTSLSTPVFLRTLSKLEDHVQHPVTAQTAL